MYAIDITIENGVRGRYMLDKHVDSHHYVVLSHVSIDDLVAILGDEHEARAVRFIMNNSDNYFRAVQLFGHSDLTMDEIILFAEQDKEVIENYLISEQYPLWLQRTIERLNAECVSDATHRIFMALNTYPDSIYSFLTLYGYHGSEKEVERHVREQLGMLGGEMFDRLGEIGVFNHLARYGYLKGDIMCETVCKLLGESAVMTFADEALLSQIESLRNEQILEGDSPTLHIPPIHPTPYQKRTVTLTRVQWNNGVVCAGECHFDATYIE